MLSAPVFDRRVALVTGGARGIGRAICRSLLARGTVVALADVDELVASRTATELSACGTIRAYGLDVTDPDAFSTLVMRIEAELGPIDILVNNAGIMRVGPFLAADPDVDDAQIDVNLGGVLNGMRAVLPRMRSRGRGHVVNIASTAGRVGAPFGAVYSASKHAVIGVTEAVRHELIDAGVDFSYICPAPVNTELIKGLAELSWPKPCEPEEVAEAVCQAIAHREVDVYVPRSARLAAVLPAVLPRRVYEAIGRALGVTRIFGDTDHDARADYEGRYRRR